MDDHFADLVYPEREYIQPLTDSVNEVEAVDMDKRGIYVVDKWISGRAYKLSIFLDIR